MIVYEVYYSDCRYEGGSVEAVYSTIEAAREYALARVREREHNRKLNNLQWARNNQDHQDDDAWVAEEPDVWGNGMEIVVVKAREIDSPEPMLKIADMIARHDEYEEQNQADHAEWKRGNKDAFVHGKS